MEMDYTPRGPVTGLAEADVTKERFGGARRDGVPDKRPRSQTIRIIALALFTFLAHVAVAEDAGGRREDQFKAAYLFNFIQFIEWPAGKESESLTVCFLGGQGVYGAFIADLDSKRVRSQRILARQLRNTEALAGCNAIYFDSAINSSVSGVPQESHILTVSDATSFAAHGGIIELFMENNRLRFNINVANAQKCGLRISSSLLKLAATIDGVPPP